MNCNISDLFFDKVQWSSKSLQKHLLKQEWFDVVYRMVFGILFTENSKENLFAIYSACM